MILSFISFVCLVLGLIRPTLFSRVFKGWATRGKTSLIFTVATLVFFIGFGIVTDMKDAKIPAAQTNQPTEDSFMYGKTKFVLKSKEGDNEQTIEEYIPEGQNFDNYKDLFAIRTSRNVTDPKKFRDAFAQNLTTKYKNKSVTIFDNKETGGYYLFFSVIDPGNTFVEYNGFKYMKNDQGEGIKNFQFVVRDYDDERMEHLKENGQAASLFKILDTAVAARQG